MTRRRALLGLGALMTAVATPGSLWAQRKFFARKPKAKPGDPPVQVYFGTDTKRPALPGGTSARGIYTAKFDAVTGKFGPVSLAAECVRPSFLAWGQVRDKRLLYAVSEGDAKTSAVSTFVLDAGGGLKQVGQTLSGGAGPCFLGVHPSGQSVYVANYDGGTVASFKVKADGTLSEPVEVVDFKKLGKHGPNGERQEGPHPHSATISPDGLFVVVCDLGNDAIVTLPIDGATGKMGAAHVTANREAGAGPRHVAFHPNGRWVYGVDELTCKMDQYLWNEVHGAAGVANQALLTDVGHTVGLIDAGFKGKNTSAEVEIGPDGRFLYASNRGEDSLVVYRIETGSGQLQGVQRIACGGQAPRDFALDPTGRWLICGNQDSGTVTVFARNEADGRLTGPVQTIQVPAPQFVLFV